MSRAGLVTALDLGGDPERVRRIAGATGATLVQPISAALPSARGVVFTLADRARRTGTRSHAYAEVIRVLAGIFRS